MLCENLIMLRNIHGYSQEEVAAGIEVSRQAYARWEKGTALPDIEKCAKLADFYGVSIDGLVKTSHMDGIGTIPPPPAGKDIWGTVTISERGQIVIPKAARDHFGFKTGQRLIVGSDEIGIALIPAEFIEKEIKSLLALLEKASKKVDDND